MNLLHPPACPSNLLRRRAVLGLALSAAIAPASAARIADQEFAERIRVAGTELQLNGVGVRQVLWIKGYAAGLYMVEKGRTPEQALAVKGPKRIQMRMLLEVEAKEFVKAIDVGMRRNSAPADYEAMQPRIAQFDRTIFAMGMVKAGDVVDLDFVPASGLVISRNGALQGTPIPGEDLYAGLMKIFIGDLPVDQRLKAGLLGGP
jgi:hypothetical protein